MKFSFNAIVIFVFGLPLVLSAHFGRLQLSPTTRDTCLKSFLRGYLRDPSVVDYKSTRYFAAFVDLRGDGRRDAIVYLMGPWCRSGGCDTLILIPEGPSFKPISKLTVTRPPWFLFGVP